MRSENGRIKLMDFGAGREMGGRSSPLAGTPLYLAPELLERTRALGPQRRLQPRRAPLPSPHGVVSRAGLRSARSAARPRTSRAQRRPRRATRSFTSAGSRHRPGHRPDPAGRYESARAVGVDLAAFRTRSRSAPWMRAMAAAAAFLVVLWAAWEIRGRQKGESEPVTRICVESRPVASNQRARGRPRRESGHRRAALQEPQSRGRQGLFRRRPGRRDPAQPGRDRGAAGALPGILVRVQGQAASTWQTSAANWPPTSSSRVASGRSGDRLRVDVQLVVGRGRRAVVRSVRRKLEDVFSIQEEIARGIVNRLQPQVGSRSAALRHRRGEL